MLGLVCIGSLDAESELALVHANQTSDIAIRLDAVDDKDFPDAT